MTKIDLHLDRLSGLELSVRLRRSHVQHENSNAKEFDFLNQKPKKMRFLRAKKRAKPRFISYGENRTALV